MMGRGMRRGVWVGRGVWVVVCGLVGVVLCGGVASGEGVDGEWYLDDFGVADAWAKGVDGSGVTIALLDGPMDRDAPWLRDANIELFDNPLCNDTWAVGDMHGPLQGSASKDPGTNFHATAMAGLYVGNGDDGAGGLAVQGVAPGARVLLFPIGTSPHNGAWRCALRDVPQSEFDALGISRQEVEDIHPNELSMGYQMDRAIDAGADIIHVATGVNVKPGSRLEAALLRAIKEKVVIVFARSNDPAEHLDMVSASPNSITYFPGALTVSGLARDNSIPAYVNTIDPGVDILSPSQDIQRPYPFKEPGKYSFLVDRGGTSSASAIMAGYIALLMDKWPQATGNQILHAVLSSTTDGQGSMVRDPGDTRGWGAFTFKYATATDPTTYPDTNPIFAYDLDRVLAWVGEWDPDALDGRIKLAEWGDGAFYSADNQTLEAAWPRIMALHTQLNPTAPYPTPSPTPTRATSTPPTWVWITLSVVGTLVTITAIIIVILIIRTKKRTPPPAALMPPVSHQPPAPDSSGHWY